MVRVPEDYLKSVVFLCVDKPRAGGIKGRVPEATGFFVRFAEKDYLVTARHFVEETYDYHDLYIRFNKKDGEFVEVPTKRDDWLLHDAADVAAIQVPRSALPNGVKPADLDAASLTPSEFVGPAPDYRYVGPVSGLGAVDIQPQVGHEICFVGLFSQHYGQERNLPIARFGHISRMPSVVQMERTGGTEFETIAYLAEFHSWGGHSGSPTFFFYPFMVEDKDKSGTIVGVDYIWVSGFMGLLSGHYDIPKKARTTGDILGTIQIKLNSGVALITPAEAVVQLLEGENDGG